MNAERRRYSFMTVEDKEMLVRMEEKMDNLKNFIQAHVIYDEGIHKEHNGRLRILERVMWIGMGGWLVFRFLPEIMKILKL